MALATPEDVATRFGRDMTELEAGTVEELLGAASDIIADAVGAPLDMLEGLDNRTLWALCVEVAYRTMSNPAGARSTQETLGQYSRSTSFLDADKGGSVFLTEREERMARRAMFGGGSVSARVPAITDDLWIS